MIRDSIQEVLIPDLIKQNGEFIRIPLEEIQNSKKLILEVKDSKSFPLGKTFEINACGCSGSLRAIQDGFTYFGSQLKNAGNNEILNDILFPPGDAGIGSKHFVIKYSMENRAYSIKDLGDGSGTFIKVESPFILKQGNVISFGDSHMLVNLRIKKKIQLKFLDGPKIEQTLYYSLFMKYYSTYYAGAGIIKIGRMTDCEIRFDDNSLSRYQCCLYAKDEEWLIEDGYNFHNSTNGTWYCFNIINLT